MATANLGLPYIAEGQAQPHVTHNEALDAIDAALGPVVGAFGSFVRLEVAEVELSGLSGATVTATDLVPDRTTLLAVISWVHEEVTGATSFDCGTVFDGARYGGSLGVALGSSNIGLTGPDKLFGTVAGERDVVLTANGGSFTGGTVRLSAAFARFGAGS